jgi:hypothetical protein
MSDTENTALNEGVLPKADREKVKQDRFRENHRDRYNKYQNEYYRNNKERINARRRERYRAKNGGNDGV